MREYKSGDRSKICLLPSQSILVVDVLKLQAAANKEQVLGMCQSSFVCNCLLCVLNRCGLVSDQGAM